MGQVSWSVDEWCLFLGYFFFFFFFFFWCLFVLSMGAVDEKCEMGAKKHATDAHASLLRKWADLSLIHI